MRNWVELSLGEKWVRGTVVMVGLIGFLLSPGIVYRHCSSQQDGSAQPAPTQPMGHELPAEAMIDAGPVQPEPHPRAEHALAVLRRVLEGDATEIDNSSVPEGASVRLGSPRMVHEGAQRIHFGTDGELLISSGRGVTRFWSAERAVQIGETLPAEAILVNQKATHAALLWPRPGKKYLLQLHDLIEERDIRRETLDRLPEVIGFDNGALAFGRSGSNGTTWNRHGVVGPSGVLPIARDRGVSAELGIDRDYLWVGSHRFYTPRSQNGHSVAISASTGRVAFSNRAGQGSIFDIPREGGPAADPGNPRAHFGWTEPERRMWTYQPANLAFSAQGLLLVVQEPGGGTRVFDSGSGSQLSLLAGTSPAATMAVHEQPWLLATITKHGDLRVWEDSGRPERMRWLSRRHRSEKTAIPTKLTTLRPRSVGDGHGAPITWIVYTAHGKRIATGGNESVRIWDARTGSLLHTRPIRGRLHSMSLTSDSDVIEIVDFEIRNLARNTLFDTLTGKVVKKAEVATKPAPRTDQAELAKLQKKHKGTCAAMSPGEESVAVGYANGTAIVWRLQPQDGELSD